MAAKEDTVCNMPASQDAVSLSWDNLVSSFFKLFDNAVLDIFVHNGFHAFQILSLPWNSRVSLFE